MKTAGIIAEYNPFHKGHEYQIKYTKERLKADYVIVAMSGDYVQRGTPALISKHARAEMALRCGADLVLEMPVSVSTASAEASQWEVFPCWTVLALLICSALEVNPGRSAH